MYLQHTYIYKGYCTYATILYIALMRGSFYFLGEDHWVSVYVCSNITSNIPYFIIFLFLFLSVEYYVCFSFSLKIIKKNLFFFGWTLLGTLKNKQILYTELQFVHVHYCVSHITQLSVIISKYFPPCLGPSYERFTQSVIGNLFTDYQHTFFIFKA